MVVIWKVETVLAGTEIIATVNHPENPSDGDISDTTVRSMVKPTWLAETAVSSEKVRLDAPLMPVICMTEEYLHMLTNIVFDSSKIVIGVYFIYRTHYKRY